MSCDPSPLPQAKRRASGSAKVKVESAPPLTGSKRSRKASSGSEESEESEYEEGDDNTDEEDEDFKVYRM